MATTLDPISFDDAGTWRWHIRTDSIRGTTEALSSLWGRVARQADRGAQPGGADKPIASDDPRLAALAEASDDGIRVRTRTSVLTLVVVAPRPEVIDRAMATVKALATRHPSRAVILSPTDLDGPSDFEAHVYASCQVPDRGAAEICTEEILIKVGGELAQHLSSTLAPLLIHDLPVVLWWPDDVPFGRPTFVDLIEQCDRLFVDSGQFRGHGLSRLTGMSAVMRDGLVVHDVSWMRLMLWRELLASCFDHPLLIRELKHLRAIRVDVARPGADERLSRASLFVGWLLSRLGARVEQPLERRSDGSWGATVSSRKREIDVEIRPVEVGFSGAVRSAGSMVRVELEARGPEAHTQVNVTRQADHLLATADWNGASVTRRATQVEPFDEAPYLATSLDRTAHDRLFAQALDKAVSLIGDLGK